MINVKCKSWRLCIIKGSKATLKHIHQLLHFTFIILHFTFTFIYHLNAFQRMYPKPKYAVITAIATCSLLILLSTACRQAKKGMNPALARYIEAYTAGVISKQSTIRVQLTGNVNITHTQNEALKAEVFDFSPDIEGKAYWIDATTIEFRPDQNLQPGKTYNATFRLSKVLKVPDDLSTFDFEFRVIKPSFSLETFGLRAADNATLD